MNKNVQFTNKVGMTIFNLEVKDFNRLVKFKEIYALNGCSAPILSINNIVRLQLCCINPTLALYLERMCFGTLDDLAINVKLDQSIDLIYSCSYNSLL